MLFPKLSGVERGVRGVSHAELNSHQRTLGSAVGGVEVVRGVNFEVEATHECHA